MKYVFITNFKTYEEASGGNAVKLVEVHARVATDFPEVQLCCAVQALDFRRCADLELPDNLSLFAQHVDPVGYGSNTGYVVPAQIKAAGAAGTLINHSEHRLERFCIAKTIEAANKSSLQTVLCCESAEEGKAFLEFEPDMLALEPPELIGGDISVSKAEADLIERTLEAVGPGVNLLVGAGVKDAEDVRIACELGAVGVLVASGICKANDPEQALRDMLVGFPERG